MAPSNVLEFYYEINENEYSIKFENCKEVEEQKKHMKNLIIKEKLFEIKVKKETIYKDIQTDKEEFEQLIVLEKCEVNKSVYENKLEEIK